MKTFKIEIKENLSRVIDIDAKDLNDAILKVRDLYYREEIVLDASDHSDTSIVPVTNNFEIEEIMQKEFYDEREKLESILIHIGLPKDKAEIISIKAGNSQAIVNEEYLHDIEVPSYFFEVTMYYLNIFYRGELSVVKGVQKNF
jgi:hypothetical protein